MGGGWMVVIIGGGVVVNAAAKHDCQKLTAVAARGYPFIVGVLSNTIIVSVNAILSYLCYESV